MTTLLENNDLRIEIDPKHGGRITSFFSKSSQREYVWYDAARLPVNPALDYDGNFAGGMDELLPCDLPENGWPDHGELWTLPLACAATPEKVVLTGTLPLCGLEYQRTMTLQKNALTCEYKIVNPTKARQDFLWKMHAALAIAPGDRLIVPAQCIQAADPGDWSLAADGMPRRWNGEYTVPDMNGSSDFFYLTGLQNGTMTLNRADGGVFTCTFDVNAFPCAWIFASFGRLNNSKTLIMEPCTNYPVAIADAKRAKVCAHLEPGEAIQTAITYSIK